MKETEVEMDRMRDTLALRNTMLQEERFGHRKTQGQMRKQSDAYVALGEKYVKLEEEHEAMKSGGQGFVGVANHLALQEKCEAVEKQCKEAEGQLQGLKHEFVRVKAEADAGRKECADSARKICELKQQMANKEMEESEVRRTYLTLEGNANALATRALDSSALADEGLTAQERKIAELEEKLAEAE